MNLLDLGHGRFLLLLSLGPLLMTLPLAYRRWLFTVISASVFMLALPDWRTRMAVVVFMLLPLLQLRWFRTRPIGPMVALLVLLFIWLNGYIRTALAADSILGAAHVLGLSYILFREIDVLVFSTGYEAEAEPINVIEYFGFLMSFWTI